MGLSKLLGGAALALAATTAVPASALVINLLDYQGTLATSPAAAAGFAQAAHFWESVLTNDITVNLRVSYRDMGSPNILGSTGSRFVTAPVELIEQQLIDTGITQFDALAKANLPAMTTGQYGVGAISMYTPGYTGTYSDGTPYGIDNTTKVYDTDGSYNNSVIGLTTANARAMGFTVNTSYDATITFNSGFSFDFDPTNGIAPSSYDFLAVSIHEIGHALGFVSGVDDYDVLGVGGPYENEICLSDGTLCKDYPANDDWFGQTLDLFRYSAVGALDWTTGTSSYFSVDQGATAYGGGLFSTGAYTGDGSQASHWIDNQYLPRVSPFTCSNVPTPGGIGIMNPTMGACEMGTVSALDLAAFDAIGWNSKVNVLANPGFTRSTAQIAAFGAIPEPASWALMVGGFGLMGGALRRQRRTLTVTA